VEVLQELKGAKFVIKSYPKSKARRTIPLSADLVDVLARHLRDYLAGRDDLVFPGLSRFTWARAHLHPAMDRAGIPRARVHDLRHSFASMLVQGGVSLYEVQRVLGHSSIETTQRYAHLAPDEYNNVLAALESPTQTKTTGERVSG